MSGRAFWECGCGERNTKAICGCGDSAPWIDRVVVTEAGEEVPVAKPKGGNVRRL